jgi:diketogulonate reductase-like aldo/keto reductase
VKLATEPLVNNQIELHPFNDQSKTIAASRRAGLSITAYTPIARGRVQGNAVLSRIGKAHGKSAAQISLRYLVQQDIIVIPKTSRPERLKENAATFDFALTPGEMKEIAALASPHGNIVS